MYDSDPLAQSALSTINPKPSLHGLGFRGFLSASFNPHNPAGRVWVVLSASFNRHIPAGGV